MNMCIMNALQIRWEYPLVDVFPVGKPDDDDSMVAAAIAGLVPATTPSGPIAHDEA